MKLKSIHDLTLSDFDENPIWKIVDHDVADGIDILLTPMKNIHEIPEEYNVYVRFHVEFNNKEKHYGIGMIDPSHKEIIGYSLNIDNKWQVFYLPPAPTFVLEKNGPEILSKRINRKIDEIFPMKFKTEVKSKITNRQIEQIIEYKK